MTDGAAPSRVLVVEDDAPMRRHIEDAIAAHPALELQGGYGTVGDAITALEANAPDVLVADLELPDGSGIDVIRSLKSASPDSLALIVTVLGDERTVVAGIQSGASGYLLKDESIEGIGDSIVKLLAGGSPISPPIARFLLERLKDAPTEEVPPAEDARPQLSKRELEVLSFVAKGFRFPEIAELLDISTHTVATYVRRIYGKLEVKSRGEAVYEALHLGLLRPDL